MTPGNCRVTLSPGWSGFFLVPHLAALVPCYSWVLALWIPRMDTGGHQVAAKESSSWSGLTWLASADLLPPSPFLPSLAVSFLLCIHPPSISIYLFLSIFSPLSSLPPSFPPSLPPTFLLFLSPSLHPSFPSSLAPLLSSCF